MISLLNLRRQHQSISDELDIAISNVIYESAFIKGKFVKQFEQEWADYIGVDHCIGVNSGTDAIKIILEAAGITGDVIVPANTAFPTAEAVMLAWGAEPIFADCGDDYTLDIEHVRSLIKYNTEAIIAVHQYGHPCDMYTLQEMATSYGLFLLEDCAHAHGAEYDGRKAGAFGDAAAWSFNAVKILGAMGDAGGITTNDEQLASKCRRLADHGRREKYTHEAIGYNSRLDGLQAAILSVKLKHLDDWLDSRDKAAALYRWYLRGVPVELPIEREKIRHAYHQFVIRVANRDAIKQSLKENNIEMGIHYPLALPDQPALSIFKSSNVPRSRLFAKEILSLPMNESITQEEVERVCQTLKTLLP